MEELKGRVSQAGEDFDAAKKRIEREYSMVLDQQKESLKQSRATYAEMMRVLRRDEQRLKELEARAARVDPAGSSPGPKGPDPAGDAAQEALMERVNAAAINLELIQMDVDQWTERFNEVHREEFELDREYNQQQSARARGESQAEADERALGGDVSPGTLAWPGSRTRRCAPAIDPDDTSSTSKRQDLHSRKNASSGTWPRICPSPSGWKP